MILHEPRNLKSASGVFYFLDFASEFDDFRHAA